MKYPKEYFKKAMDVIEKEYMNEEGVETTAILTLAAACIGLVAAASAEEWQVGEETAFYMVRGEIEPPEPYEKTTV